VGQKPAFVNVLYCDMRSMFSEPFFFSKSVVQAVTFVLSFNTPCKLR